MLRTLRSSVGSSVSSSVRQSVRPSVRPIVNPLKPSQRAYSARPEPPKMRYFVVISILAFAGFGWAVNSLERKKPEKFTETKYQQIVDQAKARYKTRAFGDNEVSVVFVLGGPGAGKGTQCANIVRDYGFKHLSAGDLLRAEQNNPHSTHGQLIATYIKEGKIVPQEVTLALLEKAMKEAVAKEGVTRFLIDGFPRKMDQAIKFEEDIAVSSFTLFFECPEEVMLQRLLKRGETSGRADDNVESIRKRFRTFVDTSMPVVKYFETADKVVKVSCDQHPDVVYAQVRKVLEAKGLAGK